MGRSRCRRHLVLIAMLLLAAALGGLSSRARAQSSEVPPELTDPLNHAASIYLGGGIYISGDQRVLVLRFSPKIRLRDERTHRFGVRLRLTGSIGVYEFDQDELEEILGDAFDLSDLVGTWAAVPGVEFPIRVLDNWTLMPFGDIGVGSDTKVHDVTVITGFGARSRAEFHDGRHEHVLWNELIFANNHQQETREPDAYRLFKTDYEMRGIVDYKLFKRDFDLGLLLKSDFYFDELEVGPPDATSEVRERWEIGLTTGATQRTKFFYDLVTAPRLGLSYRFGEGTRAYRLVVRFRN